MSLEIPHNCCFHCGLVNDEAENYPVIIKGKTHFMCCPGCQAVASAIVENGLESYYEYRTETAAKGDSALDTAMSKLAVYDEPELQEEFVLEQGHTKQIQLTVEGITCAACAWLIEKQLIKISGVKQVSVNVSARRALISWDDNEVKLSAILAKLKTIGYTSLPFQADEHEASHKKEQKNLIKKLGLAGIMTMQVMMLAFGQYFDVFGNLDSETVSYFNAVSLLLTTPVVFYSASIFYLSAFKAVQAKSVNMDVPITIAIFATYVAGVLAVNQNDGEVFFESICMFIFFILISRFLEHRARHKASQVSSNMIKLIPSTALQQIGNEWISVLAKKLKAGDKVLIKAGESVPIDAQIVSGETSVDESMLSGEFEPVIKTKGDTIYAGSINQQGVIEAIVSVELKNSMMSQILRLQESALANKPKSAALADSFSRYFVSIVLVISVLCFWYWHSNDNVNAFWISISVLVATCPCALGIATPSALTCAMAKLNKKGILLKRADALEQITNLSDIVFDKTGTLTNGEFSLQSFTVFNDKYSENYILSLVSDLEKRSEHPIAKAFDQYSSEHTFIFDSFQIVMGKGILAQLDNEAIVLGSRAFISEYIEDKCITDNSNANVFLLINSELVASFELFDTVVEDAKSTIAKISGYQLTILSGDEQKNVENIAEQLDIDNAIGNATPEQKFEIVRSQQAKGHSLLMLGDGINDAPVLSAADVSLAVGRASDLAKSAADIILIKPKLNALLDLIEMSNKTKRTIKQNIAWAISYNLLVLPFAALGLLSPWQAALGMSVSSLIVVYNSTRLMRG